MTHQTRLSSLNHQCIIMKALQHDDDF